MRLYFEEYGNLVIHRTSVDDQNPYEVLCFILATYVRKQILDNGMCTLEDFIRRLSDEVKCYDVQIPEKYTGFYWNIDSLSRCIIDSNSIWAVKGDLCDVNIGLNFNDEPCIEVIFRGLIPPTINLFKY